MSSDVKKIVIERTGANETAKVERADDNLRQCGGCLRDDEDDDNDDQHQRNVLLRARRLTPAWPATTSHPSTLFARPAQLEYQPVIKEHQGDERKEKEHENVKEVLVDQSVDGMQRQPRVIVRQFVLRLGRRRHVGHANHGWVRVRIVPEQGRFGSRNDRRQVPDTGRDAAAADLRCGMRRRRNADNLVLEVTRQVESDGEDGDGGDMDASWARRTQLGRAVRPAHGHIAIHRHQDRQIDRARLSDDRRRVHVFAEVRYNGFEPGQQPGEGVDRRQNAQSKDRGQEQSVGHAQWHEKERRRRLGAVL